MTYGLVQEQFNQKDKDVTAHFAFLEVHTVDELKRSVASPNNNSNNHNDRLSTACLQMRIL